MDTLLLSRAELFAVEEEELEEEYWAEHWVDEFT